MTKRKQEIDVDAGAEWIGAHGDNWGETPNTWTDAQVPPAMQRLTDSGIIVAAEGAISWREGHLEHVARVYAADQRLAWRDYADDLTVALSADGGTFASLVKQARRDAE